MQKLFVYGTLKRGERLHYYLKNSKYIGQAYIQGFKLFYYIQGHPILYRRNNWKKKIWGEVFLVSNKVLNGIRSLELGSGYKEGKLNGMIFFYRTEKDYRKQRCYLLPIAKFLGTRELEWLNRLRLWYWVWTRKLRLEGGKLNAGRSKGNYKEVGGGEQTS